MRGSKTRINIKWHPIKHEPLRILSKMLRLTGAAVQFLCAPTEMPWGTREAQLTDPDGHVVTLKAPADVPAS